MVCKHWNVVFQSPLFMCHCNQCAIEEFGFQAPLVRTKHNFFIGSYLNDKGHIFSLLFRFIDSKYRIQYRVVLMIMFFGPTIFSHSKNYFVVNIFTKTFRNLRSLLVGEGGCYETISRKYRKDRSTP